MYEYEKPIAELIDFSLEVIMSGQGGLGPSDTIEDGEDRDD